MKADRVTEAFSRSTSDNQRRKVLEYHLARRLAALAEIHDELFRVVLQDPEGETGEAWDQYISELGNYVLRLREARLDRTDREAACLFGKPDHACGCEGCEQYADIDACGTGHSDGFNESQRVRAGQNWHASRLFNQRLRRADP